MNRRRWFLLAIIVLLAFAAVIKGMQPHGNVSFLAPNYTQGNLGYEHKEDHFFGHVTSRRFDVTLTGEEEIKSLAKLHEWDFIGATPFSYPNWASLDFHCRTCGDSHYLRIRIPVADSLDTEIEEVNRRCSPFDDLWYWLGGRFR